MSSDKFEDLDVPARLPDGWRYVVSLRGGERRYFHAPLPLAKIRDLHAEALKAGHPFLTFEGAKWDLEDGADCAGYVLASEVLAVGYANPADVLAIDQSLSALAAIGEQQQAAVEGVQGKEQAEDESAKILAGQGWGAPSTPAPVPVEPPAT